MRAATFAVVCWLVGNFGCGPSSRNDNGDGGTCTDGQLFCNGNTLQKCIGGEFRDSEACTQACSPELGCVVCVPG